MQSCHQWTGKMLPQDAKICAWNTLIKFAIAGILMLGTVIVIPFEDDS